MDLSKVLSFYSEKVKPLLEQVPVVGAVTKDGLTTSEGAFAALVLGLMTREASKDAPDWRVLLAEAGALVAVGVYAWARSHFKAAFMAAQVESEANAKPDPVLGLGSK